MGLYPGSLKPEGGFKVGFYGMFLYNCMKLFLSLNGKTSQLTKHPSLAIAKSGTSFPSRDSVRIAFLKVKTAKYRLTCT